MHRLIARFCLCLALVAVPAAAESPETAAFRVLDEFMTAFNARDPAAFAATLNYPHVRIASGRVVTVDNAREMAEEMDFEAFARTFNWSHSTWDDRQIVQSGPDKVHVAVRFSRYDAHGQVTETFDSLYVITRRKGHWGVQARSSFAP